MLEVYHLVTYKDRKIFTHQTILRITIIIILLFSLQIIHQQELIKDMYLLISQIKKGELRNKIIKETLLAMTLLEFLSS